MNRKIRLFAIAQRLVIEHPIKYPEGYGYLSHGDIIRGIYKEMKDNSDAYISPSRIDKVLEKADATIKLEYQVAIIK